MKKNSNYTNIALISGSGIVWGMISYIYHPVMIHYLTLSEFGEFATLMGVFNILGIFVLWITLFLNKEISKNVKDKEAIFSLFRSSLYLLAILWGLLYILYGLFSPFISLFLHTDISLILVAWLSIIIACIWVSTDSVLRWTQSWRFLAFVWIFWALLKLILWSIFVIYWLHTLWAIWWILWSSIWTFLLTYLYVEKIFSWTQQIDTSKELRKDIKAQAKEITQFILVSFFFAFLMNIDIILAKNIFDDKTVWIYAGISVLGKFLVFLLISIETVYYSQITEHTKESVSPHFVQNPLVLIIIVSIWAIIINIFIGNFLLNLLKPELAGNLNLYLFILIYYSFLAIISFVSKVLVSWWVYRTNWVLGVASLLLVSGVYTFGKTSLENFITLFIIIGVVTSFLLWLMIHKELKNRN